MTKFLCSAELLKPVVEQVMNLDLDFIPTKNNKRLRGMLDFINQYPEQEVNISPLAEVILSIVANISVDGMKDYNDVYIVIKSIFADEINILENEAESYQFFEPLLFYIESNTNKGEFLHQLHKLFTKIKDYDINCAEFGNRVYNIIQARLQNILLFSSFTQFVKNVLQKPDLSQYLSEHQLQLTVIDFSGNPVTVADCLSLYNNEVAIALNKKDDKKITDLIKNGYKFTHIDLQIILKDFDSQPVAKRKSLLSIIAQVINNSTYKAKSYLVENDFDLFCTLSINEKQYLQGYLDLDKNCTVALINRLPYFTDLMINGRLYSEQFALVQVYQKVYIAKNINKILDLPATELGEILLKYVQFMVRVEVDRGLGELLESTIKTVQKLTPYADLTIADSNGNTAIDYVVEHGQVNPSSYYDRSLKNYPASVINSLLKHGASVAKANTDLSYAEKLLILDRGDLFSIEQLESLIYAACKQDKAKYKFIANILEKLLNIPSWNNYSLVQDGESLWRKLWSDQAVEIFAELDSERMGLIFNELDTAESADTIDKDYNKNLILNKLMFKIFYNGCRIDSIDEKELRIAKNILAIAVKNSQFFTTFVDIPAPIPSLVRLRAYNLLYAGQDIISTQTDSNVIIAFLKLQQRQAGLCGRHQLSEAIMNLANKVDTMSVAERQDFAQILDYLNSLYTSVLTYPKDLFVSVINKLMAMSRYDDFDLEGIDLKKYRISAAYTYATLIFSCRTKEKPNQSPSRPKLAAP